MKIILKIFFFIGFVLILQTNVNTQPSITWQKTYGDGNINYGYSIVQTPDEGYIAVGSTRVNTSNFILAMRLNKYGDTIWTKTFPGSKANQIEETSDGNYIIIGIGNLIKINVNGDIVWTKPGSAGAKLKETSDKGFIICLSNVNGPFLFYPKLIKVDSLGNIQWERIYTDSIFDGRFSDVTVDSEGNYIITGNFSDTSYIWDYLFIMKTDSFGNIIWFKKHSALLYSTSIIIKNNNYIIGGTNSKSGNKAFLSKFSSKGDQLWLVNYDLGNPKFGTCTSVINTNDAGIAFTGTYHNGDFDYYVRLTKVDSGGLEEWEKLYGFGDADFGNNINQTLDSGYIIAGIRDNYRLGDFYIIKSDKTGFSNPPVSIINNFESIPIDFILFQNYPNPFNPSTTISYSMSKNSFTTLKVFDIKGKEIKILVNDFKQVGSYNVTFDASNSPSGVYYYKLEAGDFNQVRKMILLK